MTRAFVSRSAWACAAVALLSVGCFKSVDVDSIYCATDDNCPAGYFCADSTKPGGCQLKGTGDASSSDAITSGDGARGSGGAGDAPLVVDTGDDGHLSTDGASPADAAPSVPDALGHFDVSSPVDAVDRPVDARGVDAAADVSVSVDARAKGPGDPCVGASECTNSFCSKGICVALLANGGACEAAGQCSSGNCTNSVCCAVGLTACGSTCVDLMASNGNCGSCGSICVGSTTCKQGYCRAADGTSCDVGARCASGVCTPIWVDGDGDGYGAGDPVTAVCGTTPPSGHTIRGGDCCDSNARVYPGQTSYFTDAATCGSSSTWDYNCSGASEVQSVDAFGCVLDGASSCKIVKTGTKTPTEACGTPYGVLYACVLLNGTCNPAKTIPSGMTSCH